MGAENAVTFLDATKYYAECGYYIFKGTGFILLAVIMWYGISEFLKWVQENHYDCSG